jgi:hypothetical protein
MYATSELLLVQSIGTVGETIRKVKTSSVVDMSLLHSDWAEKDAKLDMMLEVYGNWANTLDY